MTSYIKLQQYDSRGLSRYTYTMLARHLACSTAFLH